jgi:hypothetical protein
MQVMAKNVETGKICLTLALAYPNFKDQLLVQPGVVCRVLSAVRLVFYGLRTP